VGNAGRRAGLTGGQCCLGGGCETAPSLKQPTTEERVLQQGVVGQRCLSRNFNEPKLHSAERQIVCRTGGGGEFLIKSEETSQSEGAIQLAVAWRAAPHTPVLGTVSARFIVERPATRVRVGSGTRFTVPGARCPVMIEHGDWQKMRSVEKPGQGPVPEPFRSPVSVFRTGSRFGSGSG